jgi:hypothetical protein
MLFNFLILYISYYSSHFERGHFLEPPAFIHVLKDIKDLLTFGYNSFIERRIAVLMVLTRAKLGHRPAI